jgi:hypothetical protein
LSPLPAAPRAGRTGYSPRPRPTRRGCRTAVEGSVRLMRPREGVAGRYDNGPHRGKSRVSSIRSSGHADLCGTAAAKATGLLGDGEASGQSGGATLPTEVRVTVDTIRPLRHERSRSWAAAHSKQRNGNSSVSHACGVWTRWPTSTSPAIPGCGPHARATSAGLAVLS